MIKIFILIFLQSVYAENIYVPDPDYRITSSPTGLVLGIHSTQGFEVNLKSPHSLKSEQGHMFGVMKVDQTSVEYVIPLVINPTNLEAKTYLCDEGKKLCVMKKKQVDWIALCRDASH